ncbi:MAG: hypothetical protein ONB48_05475 [candidate division KSB1 bacterium]|nr:hypothetical protein [candidate division KSB1 bacterium]MDZ7272997.1 hypothetical protein [candidate division KSB1 bacterium]MDZ7285100.1 hypothetical protein [candidate division KSB1 bacterium]MDZ7298132.1 hypothetical protein [candidate division KSB1 bacterium]MDZ7309351.1 hypothetical protein [candidate division KSB1 bacterium]
MKKITFVLLVLITPTLATAQLQEQTRPVSFPSLLTAPFNQPQGLIGLLGLNPNRFSMQQSYSLSYLSLGGQGFSQGLYLNTMGYRVADNLQVALQWGVRNQPLGAFGVRGLNQNGFFLSGARLEYRPGRNTALSVQFSSYPSSSYLPYRHYDRWWDPAPALTPLPGDK